MIHAWQKAKGFAPAPYKPQAQAWRCPTVARCAAPAPLGQRQGFPVATPSSPEGRV